MLLSPFERRVQFAIAENEVNYEDHISKRVWCIDFEEDPFVPVLWQSLVCLDLQDDQFHHHLKNVHTEHSLFHLSQSTTNEILLRLPYLQLLLSPVCFSWIEYRYLWLQEYKIYVPEWNIFQIRDSR